MLDRCNQIVLSLLSGCLVCLVVTSVVDADGRVFVLDLRNSSGLQGLRDAERACASRRARLASAEELRHAVVECFLSSCTRGWLYGGTVGTTVCNMEGSALRAVDVRTENATEDAARLDAFCIKDRDVPCGDPPSFPNARLQGTSGYEMGDELLYTCLPGYLMPSGHSAFSLLCDSCGEWYGLVEICVKDEAESHVDYEDKFTDSYGEAERHNENPEEAHGEVYEEVHGAAYPGGKPSQEQQETSFSVRVQEEHQHQHGEHEVEGEVTGRKVDGAIEGGEKDEEQAVDHHHPRWEQERREVVTSNAAAATEAPVSLLSQKHLFWFPSEAFQEEGHPVPTNPVMQRASGGQSEESIEHESQERNHQHHVDVDDHDHEQNSYDDHDTDDRDDSNHDDLDAHDDSRHDDEDDRDSHQDKDDRDDHVEHYVPAQHDDLDRRDRHEDHDDHDDHDDHYDMGEHEEDHDRVRYGSQEYDDQDETYDEHESFEDHDDTTDDHDDDGDGGHPVDSEEHPDREDHSEEHYDREEDDNDRHTHHDDHEHDDHDSYDDHDSHEDDNDGHQHVVFSIATDEGQNVTQKETGGKATTDETWLDGYPVVQEETETGDSTTERVTPEERERGTVVRTTDRPNEVEIRRPVPYTSLPEAPESPTTEPAFEQGEVEQWPGFIPTAAPSPDRSQPSDSPSYSDPLDHDTQQPAPTHSLLDDHTEHPFVDHDPAPPVHDGDILTGVMEEHNLPGETGERGEMEGEMGETICTGESCPPRPPSSSGRGPTVAAIIVVMCAVAAAVIIGVWCYRRQQQKSSVYEMNGKGQSQTRQGQQIEMQQKV